MPLTKAIPHSKKKEKAEVWTLARRRAFLKLPMKERRRILAEQAEKAAPYYRPDVDWMEMPCDASAW